jgi:dihydroneopterin aldolase
MQTDQVTDTISYAELSELVRQEMAVPSQLLEHVAGRIARVIMEQFSEVASLHLEIVKENPPMGCNCDGAGVSLDLSAADVFGINK